MPKFNVDDKIIVIENGKIRKGTIARIFDEVTPNMALVAFDDLGDFEKVSVERIALEPIASGSEKDEYPEEENEPVEKSKITITPEEFEEIVCRVIAEETMDYKLVGLVFAGLMGKIHRALFIEDWENENFLN